MVALRYALICEGLNTKFISATLLVLGVVGLYIAFYDSKKEAEKIVREISRNQGAELQSHGKDMKIQRSDSHGNDPCPPIDKN